LGHRVYAFMRVTNILVERWTTFTVFTLLILRIRKAYCLVVLWSIVIGRVQLCELKFVALLYRHSYGGVDASWRWLGTLPHQLQARGLRWSESCYRTRTITSRRMRVGNFRVIWQVFSPARHRMPNFRRACVLQRWLWWWWWWWWWFIVFGSQRLDYNAYIHTHFLFSFLTVPWKPILLSGDVLDRSSPNF